MKIDTKRLANMTDIEWLIPDLIPQGSQVTLFGKPGIGKSLLALQMALTMSHTEPILFLDYEMPLQLIKQRLDDFNEFDAIDNGLNYHAFADSDVPPLDTSEGSDTLGQLLADYGARTVFIDAMAGAVKGPENDNDTYRNFAFHTTNRLREHAITTIRIDHLSIKDDQHVGPRGASRKIDDVDLAWEFQKTGVEGSFMLKNRKNRIGNVPMQIPVRRHTGPLEFIIGNTLIHVLTDEEQAILAHVNQLGLPLETGRDSLRDHLSGTAWGQCRNEKLSNVIRARKSQPRDRIGDSDFIVPTPSGDRTPPLGGALSPGDILEDPY